MICHTISSDAIFGLRQRRSALSETTDVDGGEVASNTDARQPASSLLKLTRALGQYTRPSSVILKPGYHSRKRCLQNSRNLGILHYCALQGNLRNYSVCDQLSHVNWRSPVQVDSFAIVIFLRPTSRITLSINPPLFNFHEFGDPNYSEKSSMARFLVFTSLAPCAQTAFGISTCHTRAYRCYSQELEASAAGSFLQISNIT